MSDRSMQVKVGALILVAVALLVGFIFVLGSFSVGARRAYYVELADSGSIRKGAPVKIAGVEAGRIADVEFLVERDARKSEPRRPHEPPINVRLRIEVDEKMASAVRHDSEFYVTTQGVLGEKYMEIVPGTSASPEWAAGSYIRGHDPARIDLLFAKVDGILERVEGALTSGEGGAIQIGDLVASLTKLTQHIDSFLVDNRERLDRIAANVEQASEEASKLAAYLREGVGSPQDVRLIVENVQRITSSLARDLDPTLATARKTLQSADEAVTEVKAILDRNGKNVDTALANLTPITGYAKDVMRDAAHITGKMTAGRGTIGQLIVDPEIYDDLKEMLRDLKRHPWKVLWRE
jgi:phospholipid/cholesterol/gamma-HCH transport system substrate-binding protein